jgi:hypothetical protein
MSLLKKSPAPKTPNHAGHHTKEFEHCVLRAKERYGVVLDQAGYNTLCQKAIDKRARLVSYESNNKPTQSTWEAYMTFPGCQRLLEIKFTFCEGRQCVTTLHTAKVGCQICDGYVTKYLDQEITCPVCWPDGLPEGVEIDTGELAV